MKRKRKATAKPHSSSDNVDDHFEIIISSKGGGRIEEGEKCDDLTTRNNEKKHLEP